MACITRVSVREKRLFFSDDWVEGVVVLKCSVPVTLQKLTVALSGNLHYDWHQGHLHVHHSEQLGSATVVVFEHEQKVQLNPGEITFPFVLKVPQLSIPSAVITDLGGYLCLLESKLGSIEYKLQAIVDGEAKHQLKMEVGGLRDHCLAWLDKLQEIDLKLGQNGKLVGFVPCAIVAGSTLSIRFQGPLLLVTCVVKTHILISTLELVILCIRFGPLLVMRKLLMVLLPGQYHHLYIPRYCIVA